MKNISFKVEDSFLGRLNYYKDTPEGGKTIIANFVKESVEEKCERLRHLRQGGFILTIPNPDNFHISEEEKAKALQILKQADADITKINAAFGGYFTEIIAYLQYHFYSMTEKQRKIFKDNLEKDSEFDTKLDETEDSEFEDMQERDRKAFGEEA